jgi:heavy metal sensor kinase
MARIPVFNFIRSIRFRLTLWFMAALTLLVIIVSTLLYLGLQRGLINGLDATLRDAARRSLQMPETGPTTDGVDLSRALLLTRNAPARLLSLAGDELQVDPAFPRAIAPAPSTLMAARRGEETYDTIGNFRIYTAPVRVNGQRVAVVQTAAPLDEVNATLVTLRNLLFVLLPAALALAGLGGLFFASQALAPMERVRRDVEMIEATDLSQRVSAGLSRDEIGKLAHTFDGMLDRVQRAMGRERQFTSDASHELRSPLTVIKAQISSALARPRSVEFYQRTLTELDQLTDELNTLVEDLLTLARASNRAPHREQVNMVEICRRVHERMQAIAATRGLALEGPAPDQAPVVVDGDPLKLQRVVTNLLDNALRYTCSGSVSLSVCERDGRACVEVRDTGPGIPAQHLPHIFERFYRADADRGRETGGTGLGLSIVKAIVESHGGQITVDSTAGAGSSFRFWIPVQTANSSAQTNSR